ncbi:MAG: methylenetetrahydrofolate reductase [Eubacteriales bacterium]
MSVIDIMEKRTSFSFEVFPPKPDQPIEPLLETMEHLYDFAPDFISCTYGAGGTNVGRNLEVCKAIQSSDNDTVAVTHFTCIGNTKEGVKEQLDTYLANGVNHILALRGDLPMGWEGTRGDFNYSTDLVRFIRKEFGDKFTIAVAGSPEGHIQCRSLEADIAHLKQKQDEGADYIMTQLTYDMEQFNYWLDAIRAAGIFMPVDVGVMPVLNKDACIRMCLSMNGCAIPNDLARVISKNYNDPAAFKAAGMEYTVDQIHQYMAAGVDGLHMYALNKYQDVTDIINMAGIKPFKG